MDIGQLQEENNRLRLAIENIIKEAWEDDRLYTDQRTWVAIEATMPLVGVYR